VPISPHIRALREHIGTQLLLLPSAVALVRDEDGRLLLVRHADLGVWGLPGGAVEPDEQPEETAVRETQEESGFDVEIVKLLGVFGGPEYRITYPNGDRTAYVPALYEARVVGGAARPDGLETSEVAWHEPATLETLPMTPLTRAVLDRVL
jgi:ADP-ribose pyrophosphatase YjhB (NUDIX family)